MSMFRPLNSFLLALNLSFLFLAGIGPAKGAEPRSEGMPAIHHVFLIVLDSDTFATTFGADSAAPYLAKSLPRQGALLESYFAIGHWSFDNYIALVSGQGPNAATQRDCDDVSNFRLYKPGLDSHGQARGFGCVYPAIVKTLPDQLEKAGLTWKGYMEDLGLDAARDTRATCSAARIGGSDATAWPTDSDQYVARHDPFIYFHTILDDPARCSAHVVALERLPSDLRSVATTPSYSFIVPDLCDNGYVPQRCSAAHPGGLEGINRFLQKWVPLITQSPAFRRDGLLVIAFAQTVGVTPGDFDACCGEMPMSADPDKPGFRGPGGGRVGAVVLSPFIRPGTVSKVPYNHYSLLRTVEDIFGLDHLGFAAEPGLRPFGSDVFTER